MKYVDLAIEVPPKFVYSLDWFSVVQRVARPLPRLNH